MKKGILAAVSLTAAAFVLLFALVFSSAEDGSTTRLYGSQITEAEIGKDYTVTISYDGLDLGTVRAATLKLSWDKTALELLSVNNALGGDPIFVPTEVEKSNEDGVSICSYLSLSNLLYNTSDNLMTLTFRVKDDASGSLPIDIDVEKFGLDANNDYADRVQTQDACITLKGIPPAVTTASSASETTTLPVTTSPGGSQIILPPGVTTVPYYPIAPSAPSAPASSTPAAPSATTTAKPTAESEPLRDRLAERFPILREFDADEFRDLDKNAWYFTDQYIQLVYALGLMEGRGNGSFAPDANLNLAEAITLTVRLRDLYDGGTGYMSRSGAVWYEPYLEYAVGAGIVKEGRFKDLEKEATRAEMAELFAAALPKECYEKINRLSLLPDVSSSAAYFGAVLSLFNAGILQGDNESRTFRPNDSIRRSEVAAIITRMVIPDRRIEF